MAITTHTAITIQNKTFGVIDFHSHILYGIDDGAKTCEESLSLIEKEIMQGVDTIILTPHFYPENEDYNQFIEKREKAYKLLKDAISNNNLSVTLILGAEVRISPKIFNYDLEKLCIEGTDFILIEFPFSHLPSLAKELLFTLQNKGITPIIAHAERYSYLKTETLFDYVQSGALVQVNSSSIALDNALFKKIKELVNLNLVHVVGTDTHNLDNRPPTIEQAFKKLADTFGKEYVDNIYLYGNDILNNITPNVPKPKNKKSFLFF